MKKNLLLLMMLIHGCINAKDNKPKSDWNHKGIYIVNNTEGDLTVNWGTGTKVIAHAQEYETSMGLIPVAPDSKTKLDITYSDTIDDHDIIHTCRGGAIIKFTTEKPLVLYEIIGGYNSGRGPFNRPGKGPHCAIKLHRGYKADYAKEKYPALDNKKSLKRVPAKRCAERTVIY